MFPESMIAYVKVVNGLVASVTKVSRFCGIKTEYNSDIAYKYCVFVTTKILLKFPK